MKTHQSEREYLKENPSGIFICPMCGIITDSENNCDFCGTRADGLFGTFGKGFVFRIGEEKKEIFMPIEQLKKGQENG